MKKKDLDEMKKLEIKELKNNLEKFRKNLANLQVEASLGKVKNLHSLKALKKDIAKIMTIINIKSNLNKAEKDQKVDGKGKIETFSSHPSRSEGTKKQVLKKKEAKGGTH